MLKMCLTFSGERSRMPWSRDGPHGRRRNVALSL